MDSVAGVVVALSVVVAYLLGYAVAWWDATRQAKRSARNGGSA